MEVPVGVSGFSFPVGTIVHMHGTRKCRFYQYNNYYYGHSESVHRATTTIIVK
jgi:hypothetical protein